MKKIKLIINKIQKLINSSNQRTKLIKKNILASFLFKLVNVCLDFLIVPLTLSYLTQTNYGIWLTISSIINWFNLFDLGISHGFKNKLAISLAENDNLLARKLTSTAYIIIFAISCILIMLCLVIVPLVNWNFILNTSALDRLDLVFIIQMVVICFSINLTLKTLTSIFLAKQMPLYVGLYETIAKVVASIGILLIVLYTRENLIFYVAVASVLPVIILLIFNIVFFRKEYSKLKPSLEFFEKEKVNDIMGLGFKFFVLQLGATMLFMTDNLIISHLFSPAEVTPYQISKKYFVMVLVVFTIIIAPYWSAITEAYQKNDIIWIRSSINTLNKIWKLTVFVTLFLLLIFYPFISIWVGDEISVSVALAIQWALFIILQTKNKIYTIFLNGTGKIDLQLITGLITIIVNIPLSVLFAKYLHMGSSGVLLATNCSIALYVITRKIQYQKIINNKAYGLWDS